jgi:hypothetical protein
MKRLRTMILGFLCTMILCVGCSPVLIIDGFPKAPLLPSGLSAHEDPSQPNDRRSRNAFDLPWMEDHYGEYSVVPQIANNYNDFIRQLDALLPYFIQDVRGWKALPAANHFDLEYRVEISNPIDGTPVQLIIRKNTAATALEANIFIANGETRYLAIEEQGEVTHAMLLMMDTSGDRGRNDSVEVWESPTSILTKCVRTGEGDDYFRRYHFVAQTYSNKALNPTTGYWEEEQRDGVPSYPVRTGYFLDGKHLVTQDDGEPHADYLFPELTSFKDILFSYGLDYSVLRSALFEKYNPLEEVSSRNGEGGWDIFAQLRWDQDKLDQLLL